MKTGLNFVVFSVLGAPNDDARKAFKMVFSLFAGCFNSLTDIRNVLLRLIKLSK